LGVYRFIDSHLININPKPFHHLPLNPALGFPLPICPMARFFRSLRKTLTHQIHIQQQQLCLSPLPRIISRRTYISEMRKEAFEGQISRLLRSEIQYELQSSPPSNPVRIFFLPFRNLLFYL
jgi:hypothetical protein